MGVSTRNALKMLEPCEVKISCTVLRGERGCKAPDLPDIFFGELDQMVLRTQSIMIEKIA